MWGKQKLIAFALGALMLGGMVVAFPFTGFAQDSTPTSETTNAEDQACPTPLSGSPVFTPSIDIAAAQDAALADNAGAAVLAVDLNGESGVLVYDISLGNGYEVRVDANTGEVIASEADNADDNSTCDDENDDDNGNGDDDGGHEDSHDDGEEQDD